MASLLCICLVFCSHVWSFSGWSQFLPSSKKRREKSKQSARQLRSTKTMKILQMREGAKRIQTIPKEYPEWQKQSANAKIMENCAFLEDLTCMSTPPILRPPPPTSPRPHHLLDPRCHFHCSPVQAATVLP